jgi:hypothetical protein
MDTWVSLIKELIWPLFWAIALICVRRRVGRLLVAVEQRIVAGAEFEAGPTGIKVGAAPKLADVISVTARTETAIPTEAERVAPARKKSLVGEEIDAAPTPRDIYLVHIARRDRTLDKGELEYYRVRIFLDADDPSTLDEVSEVTYYLHPTFENPIRVSRDRDKSFEVLTIVWGEFNAAATVRFKDGHNETLERYLNL